MTDAERLTELEIRIAYLEDALAALDAVITRQADLVDRLERHNRSLGETVQALRERLEDVAPVGAEPPPPHY
ncbi:MAG: SlyX family protein [Porticoccaceae bacterium]